MDNWRFVDRVSVRRVGTDWIGEARTHAQFAVGQISKCPQTAADSAATAMDALMRPRWEAHQAKLKAKADMFEDLLG